jgi:polysaccharide pyruvyl transferase WcaK-like protein
MSPSRIGLLSPPIGNGNLGDEAIITACIQGIRRLHPTASIYVISPNPGETRARHEVETYPIRWMEDPERRPAAAAARPANTGISSANADSGIWNRLKRAIKRVPWAHRTLKGLASALPRGLALIRGSGFMIQAWQELRGTDLLIIAGSGCFCDHYLRMVAPLEAGGRSGGGCQCRGRAGVVAAQPCSAGTVTPLGKLPIGQGSDVQRDLQRVVAG